MQIVKLKLRKGVKVELDLTLSFESALLVQGELRYPPENFQDTWNFPGAPGNLQGPWIFAGPGYFQVPWKNSGGYGYLFHVVVRSYARRGGPLLHNNGME